MVLGRPVPERSGIHVPPLPASRRDSHRIAAILTLIASIGAGQAASAPARPVESVVATIPAGHKVAIDPFTRRPMIDFGDDFRQAVYVESPGKSAGEFDDRMRVVLSGEPGPWYDQIEWYDTNVLARSAEKQ